MREEKKNDVNYCEFCLDKVATGTLRAWKEPWKKYQICEKCFVLGDKKIILTIKKGRKRNERVQNI